MRNLPLITGTFALMAACGVGAFMMTLMLLMDLGTKHHNNYEYYGQTPAAALIFVAGALGFLAPGIVVWYWRKSQILWQFSLRALLIAITLVAVVMGIIAVVI
jgi:hypothetical protein